MPEESTGPLAANLVRRSWRASLLVVLVTAGIWAACFRFPQVWAATGIGEADKVFLDLYGWLASGEAARLGLDPYQPNPLDFYHRPHIYAEWWLVTGRMGLTRADTIWFGAMLVSLTLAGAVLWLRPSGRRQVVISLLVLVSPAMLMAVHRANNDLVVFLLICAALPLLRQPGTLRRLLGIGLLAVAAASKYFPLAAIIVLLDARTRREWLQWLTVYAVVLLLAWPFVTAGLRSAVEHRPNPEWLHAFGAPVIFRDFGFAESLRWVGFGLGLVVAVRTARAELQRSMPDEKTGDVEREFAVGAALALGCFLLGSSYVYKLVFAVLMLPWLWRPMPPGAENRWRAAMLGLLLSLLWLEGLMAMAINGLVVPVNRGLAQHLLEATLVISQLLTWALMTCLLRALLIFAGRRRDRLAGWCGLRPA